MDCGISTRASVARVLIVHPYVSSYLWVKKWKLKLIFHLCNNCALHDVMVYYKTKNIYHVLNTGQYFIKLSAWKYIYISKLLWMNSTGCNSYIAACSRLQYSKTFTWQIFRRNMNMFLKFQSFLHTDMTQVVEILLHVRQGPTRSQGSDSSYRYRKSHCGDKTVVRSSYLHNGISYTGEMTSLYWIRALVISSHDIDYVEPNSVPTH